VSIYRRIGITVESSTADFSAAPLAGSGPVNIEFGSTVDVGTVRAGLNFHVDNGMLFLQGADPSAFGASITEGAQGKVVVTNAQSAAREIFHTATGTLDLLNKAGGVVEAIKFAAGSREYTSVGAGGQMDITTNAHAAHALPTTFTH
jgi:hypothetical protein